MKYILQWSEAEVDYEEGGTTQKIPLDDGILVVGDIMVMNGVMQIVRITNGEENLADDSI
jgi:hypothetical protein